MKLATITVAAAALLAVGGCGGDDGGAADPAALEGTHWVLSDGVDVSGWEQAAPSLDFQRGRLGGSSGCNLLGGTYEVSDGDLRIDDLSSTMMACPPPAAEVEEEFTPALERASEWRLDGEELVLGSGDGELRFRSASPEGKWSATSLLKGDAVTTLIPGTEISAEFSHGGVSGSAGCNQYGGDYKVRGASISIEAPFRTEMACDPPGVAKQEDAFLSALPRAATFKLEGGNLVLLTAKDDPRELRARAQRP